MLIDFGFTIKGDNSKQNLGTPQYFAPEVLFPPKDGYDSRVDLFSLGSVHYRLLAGKNLYEHYVKFTGNVIII